MVSTLTTSGRTEREPANTSQGMAPSSSTSSSSSSRSLFSCCFDWVSFFHSWRSMESNSMAPASTTSCISCIGENEVMGASVSNSTTVLIQENAAMAPFEGISQAASTSTSTTGCIGENEDMGASVSNSTTALIQENEAMAPFEGISQAASTSSSTTSCIGESEEMGASVFNFTTALIQENEAMAPLEGISQAASTSTSTTGCTGESEDMSASVSNSATALIQENEAMAPFEGISQAASTSTSTTGCIGENEDMGASVSNSTTALILENEAKAPFEGISQAASTSTSTTGCIGENEDMGASVSNSTTALIQENEAMAPFEILQVASTSTSTTGCIGENENMGASVSNSTTALIKENEAMAPFEGISQAPSISTSTTGCIGENEDIGASVSNSTTALIQENEAMAPFEGISQAASTSTSTTGCIGENEASTSTSTTALIQENEGMAPFEGISQAASTSTSTTDRIPENEVTSAFHEIAPSTSTSASTLMQKPCYDVFINHRGPDVKHTLATSIYNVLINMKVTACLDSQELEYGDFLPTTLEAAMRSASLHIAIFSKNYAKSSWCLAELSFMLKTGAKIIPVFYQVEPTDLRWVAQGKGIYVDAFPQYENKHRYSPEKLQEWKKALHDVSFYTGEIIKSNDDEMRLLKNIERVVLKVINDVPLDVAKRPVGLKETVQDFEIKKLQSDRDNQGIHIVGIWGMGGSGKTTLAKELYNKGSSSMERSSFIFDVRDCAAKGLLQNKQIQLLGDLGVKNETFDNIERGKAILKRRLRFVRVLIVLDDVDGVDQLDALLPAKDSLGAGSLVIVTTREYEVLRSWGISSVYKMRPLDPFHAEQLFCWHAFLQSVPLDGFEELVKKFLEACDGLPLSLKVFGGQLYGEPCKKYWESVLHKISRILPDNIKERLKISYEALDYEEKEMFLDTACFLIGEESSLAIEIWNGSGWSGLYSWERLLNKCLVELDKDNHIRMHDHLRDLGREIANQHSPYRLWLPQQIINAEKQTEKKNAIRGIMAVSTGITEWQSYGARKTFQVMIPSSNVSSDKGFMANISGGNWSVTPYLLELKIFVIRGGCFNQVMGEVSRELVWLRWFEIGQRNLPSGLPLKNLWILELYEQEWGAEHHLEELWEADSDAPVQLRELVISHCEKFQRFPNSIGCLSMLKKIVITEGLNFMALPEEFCRLQSLEHLQLCGCESLLSLPSSFGDLRNLQYLDLFSCKNLRSLPVSFKNLMLLEHLDLRMCEELTFTSEDLNILENMTKLEFLRLSGCEQLGELPHHITNQASLRELYLDGMKKLRELPVNIGQLSRLRKLEIGSQLLTSLPTSLGELSSLTNLSIRVCPKLESLPTSLGDLPSLTHLQINHCPWLECLPFSVGRLNLLEYLKIDDCLISQVDFGAASSTFALSNLNLIEIWETEVYTLSISEHRYPRLERLLLFDNYNLMEIEGLPTTLKLISFSSCEMLKNIRVIRDMVNLERLFIKWSPELAELPSFAQLTSLRELDLRGCYRIEKIEGLEYCTRLESLEVETRWEVPGIKSLKDLKKLRTLVLRANKGSAIEHCIQTIEKWPDDIRICTRAVPDAASLVNSLLSPNLVVIDSISNQKIQSRPKLVDKRPSSGDAIMLCFVINCVSSQMPLLRVAGYGVQMDQGRWVWIGLFTQRSSVFNYRDFSISDYEGQCKEEDEVEKGLVVRGEEKKLEAAFLSLLALLLP